MIKSFRGRLADYDAAIEGSGQETIRLSTNKGEIGYRIVKFQLMHNEPGEQHGEHTMKLFSVKPDDVNNTVDFSDPLLLGVSYLVDNPDNAYPVSTAIVFDNVKFNQDIFLTHVDTVGTRDCNYYIELEQVRLSKDEATVATLKDMRGSN